MRRTEAELSLETLLQVSNQYPGLPQTKTGSLSNKKAQDAKPRLLLMGLRRLVLPMQFGDYTDYAKERQVVHRKRCLS